MKRWRRLTIPLVVLLAAAALAAILEPTATVRAYLAGEPFYRGRPLRHWREVLHKAGRQRDVSGDVLRAFTDANAALPVLLACVKDPDPDVRWPAAYLLGEFGRGKLQALEALAEATRDESPEVRLKAIRSLCMWGPMARGAVPDLVAALRDPELQVGFLADLTLWEVDETAAVKAGGWVPFRSAEWGFTAQLPGTPDVSRREGLAAGSPPVHCFQAWHKVGDVTAPTCYSLAVCEYPEETVRLSPEKERLEASTRLAAFGLGGKVVSEREVEQGGRKGREHLIEVEGKGEVQARLLWSGRRLYIAQVAYKPQFLNRRAADYFLDSLRLE